jgi:hypothetical protein
MGLGSVRICTVTDVGKFSLTTVPSNSSPCDADITINPTDGVDQFINNGNALQKFEEGIKAYEGVLNAGDAQGQENLIVYKNLLKEMKKNLEEGRASLEATEKYILDHGLILDILREKENSSKRRAVWLSLTGAEEGPSNQIDQLAIEAAQQKVKQALANSSPAEIAELQREHKAAVAYAQEELGLQDPANIAKTSSILQANQSMQDNLRDEILDLENKLKNPNLTNEQRQSYEQRIEKIEKAIELLKKIENDKDFQDKIWSQLSEEQQKSILEDIKDGELTEESIQAINRATAAAEVAVYKTQTINEGFFALSKQRMREVTGLTHEDYYEKYRVQMNLDKSEFIKTNYSSNNEKDSKNSNLSLEQKIEDMILELQSRGALTPAEQSLTNKDIAQRLGLKPDHPIVLAIARGEYDSARKLSIGLNLETSVNAIAAPTTDDQVDPWRVISLTPEEISSLDLPGGRGFLGLTFV